MGAHAQISVKLVWGEGRVFALGGLLSHQTTRRTNLMDEKGRKRNKPPDKTPPHLILHLHLYMICGLEPYLPIAMT